VLDGGQAQLIELRGITRDAAIARAVTMLRDGETDRMIEGRRTQSTAKLARIARADEDANDPRNWTAAKIRRTLAQSARSRRDRRDVLRRDRPARSGTNQKIDHYEPALAAGGSASIEL